MNRKQLDAIADIICAAEHIGEEAKRVRKAIDGAQCDAREALEIQLPEWFHELEWQTMKGDAEKANSKYFQVYYRRIPDGRVELCIWCPTFLRGRGSLKICVSDGYVGGAY